jgi:hypothetical protein
MRASRLSSVAAMVPTLGKYLRVTCAATEPQVAEMVSSAVSMAEPRSNGPTFASFQYAASNSRRASAI